MLWQFVLLPYKMDKKILKQVEAGQKAYKYNLVDNAMVFKAAAKAGISPLLFSLMGWFVGVSCLGMGIVLLLTAQQLWFLGVLMILAGPIIAIILLGAKVVINLQAGTITEWLGPLKQREWNLAEVTTINQVTLQNKGVYSACRFELLAGSQQKAILCIIEDEKTANNFTKLLQQIVTDAKKGN